MKTFLRFLESLARILGSFCLIALLFFTSIIEAVILPDIPGESSPIDWDTFFILLIWLLILLLLYLLVTRSLIINLLLIPIIHLWGILLFAQFRSPNTIIDILTSATGLIVCLIGFIVTLLRNRALFFKWRVKKES